jgi:hypothetical protein
MRFTKFLMQVFVCLLSSQLLFAEPSTRAISPDSASSSLENRSTTSLSVSDLTQKLAESREMLQTHGAMNSSTVSLAAFDSRTNQMQMLSLDKDSFLVKGGDYHLVSQLGENLRVRIVRPNGVNTAVTVSDTATGNTLFPLMVRYPIERNGTVEPAYYVSAHPALISDDLIASGRNYVTTMLDQARQELAANGVMIPEDVVAVAAHLVIVEHTDHKRFLNENRAEISTEVLSLYALNRGDTFRYSVSSAGAGGMIQMIPKTYQAIREHHPEITLDADFVSGMQNHANALKAMLLYLNDTWKFLQSQGEVQQALQSGSATKTELLAAGYNSNPYKLPSYLSNGSSSWRSLIPAETQMYLAIYQSVDSNVDFGTSEAPSVVAATTVPLFAPVAALARETTTALVSWVGNALSPSLVFSH